MRKTTKKFMYNIFKMHFDNSYNRLEILKNFAQAKLHRFFLKKVEYVLKIKKDSDISIEVIDFVYITIFLSPNLEKDNTLTLGYGAVDTSNYIDEVEVLSNKILEFVEELIIEYAEEMRIDRKSIDGHVEMKILTHVITTYN